MSSSESPRIDRRTLLKGAVALGITNTGLDRFSPVALALDGPSDALPPAEVLTELPLRDLATARGVEMGSLINIENKSAHTLLGKEFSNITDASYVWAYDLNEQPGEYDFSYVDGAFKVADKNNQKITGLHLAWGYPGKVPDHVLQNGYGPHQLEALTQHVRTLAEYGKGRVETWSAINEPIDDNGTFRQEDFWVANSPWTNGLYPDYIPQVLLAAHQADPNAMLLINNFDTHSYYNRFGNWNVRADADFNLMAQLQQDQRLVDANFDFSKLGYGTQFHIMDASIYPDEATVAWMAEQTEANLSRFKNDLGVDVYVTEMDVKIHNLPGEIDAKYDHQALIYRYGIRAALNAGVRHIDIFGANDGSHPDNWKEPTPDNGSGGRESDPTLFDSALEPKPALMAVKEEIVRLPIQAAK